MKKIKKIIDTLVSNILNLSKQASKQASKHTYAYERRCSYLVIAPSVLERRVKA